MRKIITLALALLCLGATAQEDQKVAVFDPAGTVNVNLKAIVREEISSIVVNTRGYTVLERQLIDRVLEENRFQAGGLVDDNQVAEMGRLLGANLAFVTSITPMGSNLHISLKMIDVMTARIDRQQTAMTQRGENDLVQVVQRLTRAMFGDTSPATTTQAARPVVERQQAAAPVTFEGMLSASGRKVYSGGRQLSRTEVRNTMANSNALRQYNQGMNRNRKGTTWLIVGGGLMLTGIVLFEELEEEAMVFIAPGVISLGIGIIQKSASKNSVRRSVNTYNSQAGSRADTDLRLGITPNGRIALQLTF